MDLLSREPRLEVNEDTIHAKFMQLRRDLDKLELMLKNEIKLRKKTEKEWKQIKILKDEEERRRKRCESNMQQLVSMMKLNTSKCTDFMEESIAETRDIDITEKRRISRKDNQLQMQLESLYLLRSHLNDLILLALLNFVELTSLLKLQLLYQNFSCCVHQRIFSFSVYNATQRL